MKENKKNLQAHKKQKAFKQETPEYGTVKFKEEIIFKKITA